MRLLLALLLLIPGAVFAAACPVTVGTLTLKVTQPRTTGVAPFLAFFDATTTTETATIGGVNSTFNDVYYTWDFGDTGISGQGTWANGANGINQKNKATGPVAAHLYVLPTASTTDTNYTAQVWATDGTNIATCTVPVTVFAPSGTTNGFSAANTFCASTSGTFTSCPGATANNLTTASAATALGHLASGKRVLFRCGETFTGTFNIPNTVTKASIGAYGGCENISTNRPIFTGSINWLAGASTQTAVPTDVRVADLDFEGTASTTSMWQAYCAGCFPNVWMGVSQAVVYNTNCTGSNQCFGVAGTTQGGYIQDTATCAGGTSTGPQCVFPNFGENQCNFNHGGLNSTTLFCGAASYDPTFFVPISYNAFIGNNFNGNGMGGGGGGRETFRMSACRLCVLTNNTFSNANTIGGVFKFHDGNTFGSSATWVGQYLEDNVITDNLFIGESGGNKVEIGGQNDVTDERARFNIFERNMVVGGGAAGPNNLGVTNNATKVFIDTASSSIRNNVVFANTGGTGTASDHPLMISRRSNAANSATQGGQWNITNVEAYNNTCYMLLGSSDCVGFVTNTGEQANAAGSNSIAQNNLFYDNSTSPTVTNNGTTCIGTTRDGTCNVLTNNSTNGATTPNLINGSGNFSLLTDFKPQAAATGATSSVPNYFDALGYSWLSAYQLGAIMQGSPLTSNPAVVLLSQPSQSGIVPWNGTSGNFIVAAAQGAVPTNQWIQVLQDGQKNPYQANGLLVPLTAWNAGAKTGFTVVNPATAQLGFQNIAGTSAAQAEGNTVGVYINSLDILGTGADPTVDTKMMITDTYDFATDVAVWPGTPINGSCYLQVPTDVQTSGKVNSIQLNYLFNGPGGITVSFNVSLFSLIIATAPSFVVDPPTGDHVITTQLGLTNGYVTQGSGSAAVQHAAFSGFTFFSWSFSQAQFAQALVDSNTALGTSISTDPTQYKLTKFHVNAEFHTNGGHSELGWSMHDFKTTQ